jgi:hypothetical protein
MRRTCRDRPIARSRSAITHYFLAELLLDHGRRDEARAELRQVIDAPLDPEWAPEDREFKQKAARLLESR